MERKDKLAYYVVMGMIVVGVCFYPEVFDSPAFKYSLFTQPKVEVDGISNFEVEVMTDFCDFTCRSEEEDFIKHQLCLSGCERSSKLEISFFIGMIVLGSICALLSYLCSANPTLITSIKSNIKYLYIRIVHLIKNQKPEAIILNSKPTKSSQYDKSDKQSVFNCDESTFCDSKIQDTSDLDNVEQFEEVGENEFVRIMDALDDDFADQRILSYKKASGYSLIA